MCMCVCVCEYETIVYRVSFGGGGGGGGIRPPLSDSQEVLCMQSYSCLPALPCRAMIPPPLERFSKRNTGLSG